MKQTITGPSMPMAAICINKSRLKIYHKETTPTVYLSKDTEFQIELFNPTSDTILAKIQLNGNQISQGGLVLRPGERVFLERYLDVAKKFKFDTYEVANTAEVKKAIKENGNVKIDFYTENIPSYWYSSNITINNTYDVTPTVDYLTQPFTISTNDEYNGTFFSNVSLNAYSQSNISNRIKKHRSVGKMINEQIETGRIDAGSNSNQKLETVNKSFNYYPFHSLEYKLLPTSQKINGAGDINVRKYCTNCGCKAGKVDKFCSQCGNKL